MREGVEFKRDAIELFTLLFSANFIECHPPSQVLDTQQPLHAHAPRCTFAVDCHLMTSRVDNLDKQRAWRSKCERPSLSCKFLWSVFEGNHQCVIPLLCLQASIGLWCRSNSGSAPTTTPGSLGVHYMH